MRCSSISGGCAASRAARNTSMPAGLDLKQYPSVVIWCEQFGVLISPADLKFESDGERERAMHRDHVHHTHDHDGDHDHGDHGHHHPHGLGHNAARRAVAMADAA